MTTGTAQLRRCTRLYRNSDGIEVRDCGRIATHRQTYRAVSGYAVEAFRCDEHRIPADARDHLTTTVLSGQVAA